MNAIVVPLNCAVAVAPVSEIVTTSVGDRAYILELEHENLELRNAVADIVLARRRAQAATARWPSVALLSAAFLVGWLLDPPARLWGARPAGHHVIYGATPKDDGHRG